MTPRAWRSAIVAIIVTVLLIAGVVLALAAHAADIPASGVRLTSGQPWHTCVPKMIGYRSQYRIENDLFAGKRGKLCIRSTGDNLTVTTNLPAQPGGVVAAPGIRVGGWYGSADPQSVFPVSVRLMPRLTDHVAGNCRAPGEWLEDTDSYGYTSAAAAAGNPAVELVIANCWHDFSTGGHLIRVSGHWWHVSRWVTSGGAQGPHPLILFTLARQSRRVAERLPAFVWQARRHGWWPRAARVLGNTCLQLETWSGGRGLRLALQVTDSTPVIHSLGGSS